MSPGSLREKILKSQDLPRELVVVPEWNGEVLYVRTLTAAEKDAFEASVLPKKEGGAKNLANIRARLAVLCTTDEGGTRVFNDDDAELLGAKSAAAVSRLSDVAQRLNGMTKEAVEELAKT